MSKALIIGSIALDTIETPHGSVERILGGSASYGGVSASYFTGVSLVGVIGEDFPEEHVDRLKSRGIDFSGVERVSGGKTFHWTGKYEGDMNQAITIDTELGVFAEFQPKLTEEQKNTPYIFLANIHPALQLDVLKQVNNPKFVCVDTMNLWIEHEKGALTEVLKKVDLILMNDQEARMFTGKANLIECAKDLLALGPQTVAIKKGEHGALLFQKDRVVFFPAYPLENVKDPTGAGDTFAGGMIGYLARTDSLTAQDFASAIHVGTCMASFVVEDFSIRRTIDIKPGELKERTDRVLEMVSLEPLDESRLVDYLVTTS